MSNPTIPKEEITSIERWEMPRFGKPGLLDTPISASFARQNKNRAGIALPTAVQLEEIQQQAQDEGYRAGFTEGLQRVTSMMSTLEQALQQVDQTIAQDLLKMSLEVARQMVQQALSVHPEILLNTIREAISSLPHFNQSAHLILHPEDAAMLRKTMGEQLAHSGWKIFEDMQIERGGARIETANSQIDATMANRWQRIVAAIGQDSSWIQK